MLCLWGNWTFQGKLPNKESGKTDKRGIACNFCGKKGDTFENCWQRPENRQGKQSGPVCVYCGESGHFMIKCLKYQSTMTTPSALKE